MPFLGGCMITPSLWVFDVIMIWTFQLSLSTP